MEMQPVSFFTFRLGFCM